MFPSHCVRGTPGARIVPEGLTRDFRIISNDPSTSLPQDVLSAQQVVLEKQTFDVFDNPHASELVERLGANTEYVMFGVVTEFCISCAAKGLIERGHRVAIVTDAIETLHRENGRRALEELRRLGARFVTTDEALAEVNNAAAEVARMRS
jgi:nicotinamidase/pyrazinamidase